jgi:hypothetical protein
VENERAHTRLYFLENSLEKGLQTCRRGDYVIMWNEDDAVLLDKANVKSIIM